MVDGRCRIEMLGQLRISRDGVEIPGIAGLKAGLLLAYLALQRDRGVSRERLVDLFWPDLDFAAARDNLSTALSTLRRRLEPAGTLAGSVLHADRQNVTLRASTVGTDVAEFETAVDEARRHDEARTGCERYAAAAALYRGDFLPAAYDDWALAERTRLAEMHAQALGEWSEALEKAGDLASAMRAARLAVQSDAYGEAGIRRLMRLQAASGQVAAALDAYQAFEKRLDEELGVTPSRATRDLAERLRRAPAAVDAGDAGAVVPQAAATTVGATVASATLPAPLTRFVGRDVELGRLQSMLRPGGTRLLTLLGPGGAGKTRLSIEIARRMAAELDGRAWFAPLADLATPALLPSFLASTLQITGASNSDPLDRIVAALGERPALLVLDNFEHLLGTPTHAGSSSGVGGSGVSGATFVRLLLERAPALVCLATSRRPLRLSGEQEYPLPPLALPEADGDLPIERLEMLGSVALFVDRARAVKPDFELDATNRRAVGMLCRRLEGIPLSIEMAAAWVRALPPTRILDRLEKQLDLLVSRRSDLPARHRSLRATVEWSYELLAPEEQRLFTQLSVFRGGWTLEAAEAICGAEALELLTTLQDQSMIELADHADDARYRMLEPLREYALEKRSEHGDDTPLRRRHAEWYLRLVETQTARSGAEAEAGILALDADRDNVRAALTWCRDADSDLGLAYTGALPRYWNARAYLREAADWARVFVVPRLASEWPPDPVAVRALHAAGSSLWRVGDYAGALACHERSATMYRALGDDAGLTGALNGLANALYYRGDQDAARPLYEEALAVARRSGDPKGLSVALNNLGLAVLDEGKLDAAQTLFEEALVVRRSQNDRFGIANVVSHLGDVALRKGDLPRAQALLAEALTMRRDMGDRLGVSYTLHSQVELAMAGERWEEAKRALIECMRLKQETGERWGEAMALQTAGELLLRIGRDVEACRLCSAADANRTVIGAPIPAQHRAHTETMLQTLRTRLGDIACDRAWQEGRTLSTEAAIAILES